MNPAGARAFVGLGSNLGDPQRQVLAAIDALAQLPDTRLRAASKLYRTPPWGITRQPPFVNAVAELDTGLAPEALLAALVRLEQAAGRARVERWGPRVLDLDLLCHGDTRIDGPALTLPHPHIAERAFVLVPLAELDPLLEIPGQGRVDALLAAVDQRGIEALV